MTKPISEDSYARVIGHNKFRTNRLEARPDSHGKLIWKVFGDTEAVVVGEAALTMGVPKDLDGLTLRYVAAFVSTAGSVNVQIRNITQAHDMLLTPLTIDAAEFDSYTAAVPAVINTANDLVARGDRITVDVDAAGGAAMGLSVHMIFA